MAIEVFNRYEKKYIIEGSTFEKLQNRLFEYMKPDKYNENDKTYSITNLYYDTPDNYFIRTSLQKPKYKEKLRLRAYGVPEPGAKVYAEVKKKVSALVNKRRSEMKLEEAYEFLKFGELPDEKPYHNRQVLHEISYILKKHELRPALYIAYDRRAYFGIDQKDLRISFDCNIRTRRYDLALEAGDYGSPLLGSDCLLMEIKTAQSMPLWLCKLLSEYKIYPTAFSKYGAEYRQMLEAAKAPQVFYNFVPKKAACAHTGAVKDYYWKEDAYV